MSNNGQTTYIESLGVYLPANETSSESRVANLKSRIRVPLERFTGIKSTRRVSPGEYSLDLACRAIERSLERSRFRAEDIGLLIACNISKYDQEGFVFPIEPATATRLRLAMGFGNAIAFDVNNACAGMFTAILVADAFLHMSGIEAALVVSGEYISHLADAAQLEIRGLSDSRMACLTLGDSGAAAVLARSGDGAVGFQHIGLHTLGAYSSLCRSAPAAGKGAVMITDSAELLRVGTLETAAHFVDSMHTHGWNPEKVDHVIPHQVSKGCFDELVRQVNSRSPRAKLARSKIIDNLPRRGNTATTTHLVALHDHMEQGRIGSGDQVVFSVTASGLTVGTALYAMDDLPVRLRDGAALKELAQNGVRSETVPGPFGGARRTLCASPERVRISQDGLSPLRPPSAITVASVASTRLRRETPQSTEEIALEAAEACLAKGPCLREEIEVLIFAGVFKSGFLAEPSYASILSGRLFPKAKSGPNGHTLLAFDVQQGPNGFLAACEILRMMMGRRGLKAGLVVAAEFENNRLLAGYPQLGVAEVASAAVIMAPRKITPGKMAPGKPAPGKPGIEIGDCDFFLFDEYADRFRADALGVSPVHVSFQVREDYEASLRCCILRAIGAYLPRIGRALGDFDRFYFPQISPEFLDALAVDLQLPRERLADVTIPGRDLFTSSLLCILESATLSMEPGAGSGEGGRICLAVSAGPGINVGCAVVRA